MPFKPVQKTAAKPIVKKKITSIAGLKKKSAELDMEDSIAPKTEPTVPPIKKTVPNNFKKAKTVADLRKLAGKKIK